MDLSFITGNMSLSTEQKISMIETLGLPIPPDLVAKLQAEQAAQNQANQPNTTDMIPMLEGAEMTIALKRGAGGAPEAYFFSNGSYQRIGTQAEFIRIAGQYFK